MIKSLNKSIKQVFPECDTGCNDCIYFEQKSRDKKYKDIRYGECLLPIETKQNIYKDHKEELDWEIALGKKVKDLINESEVMAIANYCCSLRCFLYRRYKDIDEWRNNKNNIKIYEKI